MKTIHVHENEYSDMILAYSHLLREGWSFGLNDWEDIDLAIAIIPLEDYFSLRTHRLSGVDVRYFEERDVHVHALFPSDDVLTGRLDREEFFSTWIYRESSPIDLFDTLVCILVGHNAYAYDDAKDAPRGTDSPIEASFLWEYKSKPRPGCPPLICQHNVGKFRLDFAVPEMMLCIELDGHEFHKTQEQRTHDAARERWLQLNDWRVIRFTGSEIHKDVSRCVNQAVQFILKIKEQPHGRSDSEI